MKTIDIFGVIGEEFDGLTSRDIAAQLEGHEGDLLVRINSPGGLASEGVNIYNMLKTHEPIVEVGGIAASAASIVMMAGRERRMLTGSRVMIHKAWGFVIGNGDDFSKASEQFNSLDEDLADIYAEGGMDRDEALAAMAAETYYRAGEALDAGLATHVDKKEAAEAPAESAVILQAMGCRLDTDMLEPEAGEVARLQLQMKRREAASILERHRKMLTRAR